MRQAALPISARTANWADCRRTIRNHPRIGSDVAGKTVAIPIPEKSLIWHPKTVDFG
jgi:hypothetical protein